MKCKLCLKDTELVKRSHIYPRWIYSWTYGDGSSIIPVSLDVLKRSGKNLQSGFHEANILCLECEGSLGKLDSYGAGFFKQSNLGRAKIMKSRISFQENEFLVKEYDNVDYALFKLFILSLLWRASISKVPFFKKVDLGAYENAIRKMLIESEPGPENLFRVSTFYLNTTSLKPKGSIMDPIRVKGSSGTKYYIYFNGYFFIVNISDSSLEELEAFKYCSIKENKNVAILFIEGAEANKQFDKIMGKSVYLKKR